MSAPLLRFALVHPGASDRAQTPRTLHIGADHSGHDAPRAAIHLLVVDARRMNDACRTAALDEARRLRAQPGFRHGVLVCDVPHLSVVQQAIRAGLRDIIQEPLSARKLVQLLRSASPGHRACARQISALAAIVRTLGGAEPSSGAAALARREYALVQRAEQLAHTETRLQLERAALEDREQKLRASARRIEREYAALQSDTAHVRSLSASPFSTSPFSASAFPAPSSRQSPASRDDGGFVADMHALAAQLQERATALDIRERMLREMEALLTAQPALAES